MFKHLEANSFKKSSFSAGGGCVEAGIWKKASFSNPSGSCVEAGVWNKSSYSHQNGGCVETTADDQYVLVRDTKISREIGDAAPVQAFTLRQWQKLLTDIKSDTFLNNTTVIKFGIGNKLIIFKYGDTYTWHLSRQTVIHEYTQSEMDAFVKGVKAGEFDLAPELAMQVSAA